MTEKKYVVINALVDDHVAAEEVLRSFFRRELPSTQVFHPRNSCAEGFELAAVIPAATSLDDLNAAVAAELDLQEILYVALHLEVLDDG